MNVSCDNCQRRYSIADEKVRGRTVQIRCRNCQSPIKVVGLTANAEVAPPAWWAMLSGEQCGPFGVEALAERIRAGAITERTFLWRKGLADWQRAAEVPELVELLRRPPPAAAPVPPVPPRPASRDRDDPFLALGEIDPAKLPAAGESTAFFIAQAGVNKRNPPWKIAAFVGGGAAVVLTLFLVLSSLERVPGTVARIAAADDPPTEGPAFPKEAVTGLGSKLLGRQGTATQPGATATPPTTGGRRSPDPKPQPGHDELAALYGDTRKASVSPKVRAGIDEGVKDTASGLSEESIAKVVSQSASAFQMCIEQALRKNPNLRFPKFHLVATVAPSGVVTRAHIDRRDLDGSSLGECLKLRAKRMVFASFSGEALDIEIPLIVGVAM